MLTLLVVLVVIAIAVGLAYEGFVFWKHNRVTLTKAVDKVETDATADVAKAKGAVASAETAVGIKP